jgi:hypothetical protein
MLVSSAIRLRRKTSWRTVLQRTPLDAPPTLEQEESSKKKVVYLVTVSHPHQPSSSTGVALVSPDTLDHQAVLDALLDAFDNPE